MTSDVDFVLGVLRRGPASTNAILAESFAERGVGLTVHSRVADLRPRLEAEGETITCRREGRTPAGRPQFVYSLVEVPLAGQLSLIA